MVEVPSGFVRQGGQPEKASPAVPELDALSRGAGLVDGELGEQRVVIGEMPRRQLLRSPPHGGPIPNGCHTRNSNTKLLFLSMINPARLVPGALQVIDTERWERQSCLLALIAARTWDEEGRSAALIAQRELGELGRSPGQVRWDREILRRLEEQRVIRRWPAGPRGHFVVVRHPVDWRRVPWLPSRRAALARLRAYESAVVVASRSVLAGQTWPAGQFDPEKQAFAAAFPAQTTDLLATTTDLLATAQTSDQGKRFPQPHSQPQKQAPYDSAFRELLSNSPSLPPGEETREGGREELSTEGQRLAKVLADTIGAPVFGRYARRLDTVARRWPERLEELEAAARGLAGMRSVRLGVETLEGYSPAPEGPGRPIDTAAIAALAATYQRIVDDTIAAGFEPDPGELAELARLQSLLESCESPRSERT